jgi:hypothetical protein
VALGITRGAGERGEIVLMAGATRASITAAGVALLAACAPAGPRAAVAENLPAGFATVADGFEFGAVASKAEAPAAGSAFALASPGLAWIGPGAAKSRSISSNERGAAGLPVLSAARAQILLRSLTVPGWGQATLGHNGAAKAFILVETGIWASFAAFHIQEAMRRDSYERSARINAGIDLGGRDEEYRRIVGGFLSSDDYNQFVVYRDAANLYYEDPVKYRAYIAEHELKGADAWHWASIEDLFQYRAQRKDSQRASQRANTALALAVVNRFVSALHAARIAGRPAAGSHSWNLEVAPAGDGDLLAVRCGVSTRF